MNPEPRRPFAGVELLVHEEIDGWQALLGAEPEALVRRALLAALHGAGLPEGMRTELGVTLTGDEAVRALNEQWRGQDKPTNVLSFPAVQIPVGRTPGPMMGDLVLALETVAREAAADGKPAAEHFVHLVVHGILHLVGHDHMGEEEAERMEALEISILAGLSIANPYLAEEEERPAVILAT